MRKAFITLGIAGMTYGAYCGTTHYTNILNLQEKYKSQETSAYVQLTKETENLQNKLEYDKNEYEKKISLIEIIEKNKEVQNYKNERKKEATKSLIGYLLTIISALPIAYGLETKAQTKPTQQQPRND